MTSSKFPLFPRVAIDYGRFTATFAASSASGYTIVPHALGRVPQVVIGTVNSGAFTAWVQTDVPANWTNALVPISAVSNAIQTGPVAVSWVAIG